MSEPIKQSSSYSNFKLSLKSLNEALSLPITEARDLAGIVKNFEMTYELSWKVLKKILRTAGHETLGAKDVYTKAFQLGYIDNQSVWLKMIEDRNLTAHLYDEKEAKRIVQNIQTQYVTMFVQLCSDIDDKNLG